MRTSAELVAELRRRADEWVVESNTATQEHTEEERRYWLGYARGLRAAADAIELNLK